MEQTETVTRAITNESDAKTNEFRHPNGQTDEQIRAMLSVVGRHKNNPEYIERVFNAAEVARRQINEEYLREMDAEARK